MKGDVDHLLSEEASGFDRDLDSSHVSLLTDSFEAALAPSNISLDLDFYDLLNQETNTNSLSSFMLSSVSSKYDASADSLSASATPFSAPYSPFSHTLNDSLNGLSLGSPSQNFIFSNPYSSSPSISFAPSPAALPFASPHSQAYLSVPNQVYIVPSPMIPYIPSPLNPLTTPPDGSSLDWTNNFDELLRQQQQLASANANSTYDASTSSAFSNGENRNEIDFILKQLIMENEHLDIDGADNDYSTATSNKILGDMTQYFYDVSGQSTPKISVSFPNDQFQDVSASLPVPQQQTSSSIPPSPNTFKASRTKQPKSPKNGPVSAQFPAHIVKSEGSTLYQCPFVGCDKKYTRPYNLKSHYRVHTGERPFVCEMCPLTFTREHDLKRHIKLHE
ncbi:Metallothionein expression activator [Nowakowskiella sp. JEL0078]|nr:Metallothionein expression activator [Nowakowskiella sp. JEL0078]